jgi:hypothetical protein
VNKREQRQLDLILAVLEDLQREKGPKQKDIWDKIGIAGQLISGVFLVALGLYVSWSVNNAQKDLAKQVSDAQIRASQETSTSQIQSSLRIAEAQGKTSKDIAEAQAKTSKDIAAAQNESQEFAQRMNLDATNRQMASDYLGKLIATQNFSDRAALLESLDVALKPEYSVPLALRFTRPVQLKAKICKGIVKDDENLKQQNTIISRKAIELLDRLKFQGAGLLRELSHLDRQPDASIANAVLGNRVRVLFRVSEIDDYADVYINDALAFTYQFGRESGWVDITDRLLPRQENRLYVLIRNSSYEGTGVRLEIRAGAEQYDRFVYRDDWTGASPSFGIGYSIGVDTLGVPHLNGDNIQVQGWIGQPHC